MGPFDHAWLILKAAGRMSPVGGSAESQPVGRYNSRMEDKARSKNIGPVGGINPREFAEEAEPPAPAAPADDRGFFSEEQDISPTDPRRFGESGFEYEGPSHGRIGVSGIWPSDQEGPPVSSGQGNIPLEQKVEHARGFVPRSDEDWVGYPPRGPPTAGHGSRGISREPDSSVYGGWKEFDPKVAPLSQEIYQQR